MYIFISERYCHVLMIDCPIDRLLFISCKCADIVYHVIVDFEALGCFELRKDQLYCDRKTGLPKGTITFIFNTSNQSMVILLVLTGLHCTEMLFLTFCSLVD